MRALVTSLILGASMLVASSPSLAQPKPEDVIKFRKGVFQVAFWHFRPLGAMAKGEIPFDQASAARNAEIVAMMGTVIPSGFPAGTDKGDTRARSEIWTDPAGFRKVAENFQAEASKLEQMAKTATSVDQLRAQIGVVAKACSACHDNYRTK
jgi:cytochrome c556